MAGEWIAMRMDLWTSPEVLRLSAFCQQNVSANACTLSARALSLGALYRTWCLIDLHAEDGLLPNYTPENLDNEVGMPGWTTALEEVGWIVVKPQGLGVPGFEAWFSRSARRRILNAKYQRESRTRRQQTVSNSADKKLTTEQKRTVHNKKKKTPLPPTIPRELDSPEFRQMWNLWKRHREEIRKPLKPTSTQQQLAMMAEWGQDRAISAMRYTIAKGWQGLREPEPSGDGRTEEQSFEEFVAEYDAKKAKQEADP